MSSKTIYHTHHIIPKHMGGSDAPSNLIKLTIEEHAQAHLELYKKHGHKEDYVAYMALSSQIGREEILLEKARLGGYAKARKGYPAWNKGKPTSRSKESIEKQKATITGVKRGKYNYAKPHPNSKSITIGSATFNTLGEAEKKTGISKKILRILLKDPSYVPKKMSHRKIIKQLQRT